MQRPHKVCGYAQGAARCGARNATRHATCHATRHATRHARTGHRLGCAIYAEMEDTLTIAPPPVAAMGLAHSCVSRAKAMGPTAKLRSKSSVVALMPPAINEKALLMSRSIRPCAASTAATSSSQKAELPTSPHTMSGWKPTSAYALAPAAASAGSPEATTIAPSRSSSSAHAKPMPCVAPVTSATLPTKRFGTGVRV